jgi:hypothetical protein
MIDVQPDVCATPARGLATDGAQALLLLGKRVIFSEADSVMPSEIVASEVFAIA